MQTLQGLAGGPRVSSSLLPEILPARACETIHKLLEIISPNSGSQRGLWLGSWPIALAPGARSKAPGQPAMEGTRGSVGGRKQASYKPLRLSSLRAGLSAHWRPFRAQTWTVKRQTEGSERAALQGNHLARTTVSASVLRVRSYHSMLW